MDVLVEVGRDGLERLRDAGLSGPAPFQLDTEQPESGRARLRHDTIGGCAVASLRGTGRTVYRCRRSAGLIRRSDPDSVCLVMPTAGSLLVSQEGVEALLLPGQFAFYHTSKPYEGVCRPSGTSLGSVFVGVPRASLPTRRQRLRDLLATVLRVPLPLAGLVGVCLRKLAADATHYPPAIATNLSDVVVDLFATVLTAATGTEPPTSPLECRRILLMQAKAHIDHHLHDPTLCPASVAAALHVSLRTLYRAFDEQDQPAAAWIRQRRLERCRRDLIDPARATTPVLVVARRWGFTDATQFSRAFRRAFGLPPDAYRRAVS